MKIFLTGATGFVPSNLVLHFFQQGDEVIAFDQHPPEERLTPAQDVVSSATRMIARRIFRV